MEAYLSGDNANTMICFWPTKELDVIRWNLMIRKIYRQPMRRCPPCLVIFIKGWLTYTTFEGTKISAIVTSYFINMHTHILLLVLGLIIWASQIFGHAVPRRVENMNGDYLISNPNLQSINTFSTRFSDRPDVEYFDLYTPEISTRYDRYRKLTFD